jgi:hypothetical protein
LCAGPRLAIWDDCTSTSCTGKKEADMQEWPANFPPN